MIASMKKIAILCLESDRDRTLEALHGMGVVHVIPAKQPAGPDLDSARRKVDELREAIAILKAVTGSDATAKGERADTGNLPSEVLAESRAMAESEARIAEVEREIAGLEPFGDFDPAAIQRLSGSGVSVRLCSAPSMEEVGIPREASVHVLQQTKEGVTFALVARTNAPLQGAKEFPLPARSMSAAVAERGKLRDASSEARRRLARMTASLGSLEAAEADMEGKYRFAEARAGMGADRKVAYLLGFCPEDEIRTIESAAKKHGWCLLVEDPGPDEHVPTLLRMPRWVRPVKAVLDMLGILPGYREADVGAVFLLFFSLFFAMLIGDAGYGLLFLGLTALLKWKIKDPPPNMIPLLAVLSVATIVWGILTGSFFFMRVPPGPLAGLKIEWLGNEENIQSFCFLIGALHLTVAHAWNFLLQIRTPQAIAQIGWICICWTMYYAAGFLVLGREAPGFLLWLFIAGTAMVTVFMTPFRKLKSEWSNHIMLPLSIIGNFGDVVSYLRLFLVGSASVTLILAFNEMALGSGVSGFVSGLVAALIVFAAHAMNIALGVLAVLVHGVRLNALEFSTHFGIQWSGTKFRPFGRSGT